MTEFSLNRADFSSGGTVNLLFVDAQPARDFETFGVGPYPDLMQDVTGVGRLSTVNVADGEDLPTNFDEIDGIIIGGSGYTVTEGLPWMKETQGLVEAAHAEMVPVAGICFGHQLVGTLHGADVVQMPKKIVGYKDLTITEAGKEEKILDGLDHDFLISYSHRWRLAGTPPGLPGINVVEAARETHGNEVIVYKLASTGVPIATTIQGHPELPHGAISALARKEKKHPTFGDRELSDQSEFLRLHVRAKSAGKQFMENWMKQQVIPLRTARTRGK